MAVKSFFTCSSLATFPLRTRARTPRASISAAVIDADGKYLGKYRKTHIPQVDPGFYEKFFFRPGNLGYRSMVGAHCIEGDAHRATPV
mgnify:CR=1 FL=1